jgi:hypothetical protein
MRKIVTLFCTCALLLGLAGCGGMKGEAETKESLAIMREAIANKDAKAEETKKKTEALAKRMEALNLTAEEKKKLEEKFKPEMEKLIAEMMKAMKNP